MTDTDKAEDLSALAENIQTSLDQAGQWINNTLDSLGWTESHLIKTEDKHVCPLDSDHRVPKSCLDKHVMYCPLLKDGYTRVELEDDKQNSSGFFYEHDDNGTTVNVINIDESTMATILSRPTEHDGNNVIVRPRLPATQQRAVEDLTSAEKLKVYEYCTDTARQANKTKPILLEDLQLPDSNDTSDVSKPKSKWEHIAEERDMKRRRQSYRKVHTGKKSYLEVIREVIEQQTGLLDVKNKNKEADIQAKEDLVNKMKTEPVQERSMDCIAKEDGITERVTEPPHQREEDSKRTEREGTEQIGHREESDTHKHEDRSQKKKHDRHRSPSESKGHRHKHKKHKKSKKHKKEKHSEDSS